MKNEERNRSIEELIEEMDLHKEAPEEEPFRQYYFIKKARAYYQELSRQEGKTSDLLCHDLWLSDERQRFGKAVPES